ncbi:hypothetical protein [Lactococcus lactis]|uniref:hypothetical protein n=1 Tax=Lactococcus lactis TaxID=1358 RepID=UPI00288E97FA|nr:hypothetical protein [Lactococcus lactis]MDT2898637.1 hypothetical protein [Lactococcus lactis]MDT2949045.1 hypothetical protein [Lactococcus lactis]
MMFETVKYYGEGISGNIVERETPYGFSRMKHKKRTKKTVSQPLTLDDFKLMGEIAGKAAKAFVEGYTEGIK